MVVQQIYLLVHIFNFRLNRLLIWWSKYYFYSFNPYEILFNTIITLIGTKSIIVGWNIKSTFYCSYFNYTIPGSLKMATINTQRKDSFYFVKKYLQKKINNEWSWINKLFPSKVFSSTFKQCLCNFCMLQVLFTLFFATPWANSAENWYRLE